MVQLSTKMRGDRIDLMSVPREKLYEEVWAEPMTKVAARYDVSSNFLARVCERLHVPHPTRGYWAKLTVGKARPRPNLPPAQPGDELEWSRHGEARSVVPEVRDVLDANPANQVETVPSRRRPTRHGLLAGAEEYFAKGRVSEAGYLKPFKRLVPDIFVSRDCFARALRLAKQLYLEFESRGHRVVLAPRDQTLRRGQIDHREGVKDHGRPYYGEEWAPERPTVTFIGPLAIGLTIFELSEHVEARYVSGQTVDGKHERGTYVRTARKRDAVIGSRVGGSWTTMKDFPTGKLCLRAYSPYGLASWAREWREDKAGELLERVDEVVQELERATPEIVKLLEEGKRQAAIAAEEHARQWREYERQEQARKRIEARKESREELLSVVEKWGLAVRLEGFFDDIVRRAQSLSPEERATVLERAKRARELLGGVDALGRFKLWRSPDERFPPQGNEEE